MMTNYGIFTSGLLEVAQTKLFALCLYNNSDNTVIGAKLYSGTDSDKKLVAVCERNLIKKTTAYVYKTCDGQVITNDGGGVMEGLIESSYSYDIASLKKVECISICEEAEMPTVSEAGVATCLKKWRLGTFYYSNADEMQFQLVTNKIEYIFSIENANCNIYCGAGVSVTMDDGLLGGRQYFRLRNFGDNSQPFCKFYSDLGKDIIEMSKDKIVCDLGKCTLTPQGLFFL